VGRIANPAYSIGLRLVTGLQASSIPLPGTVEVALQEVNERLQALGLVIAAQSIHTFHDGQCLA